MHCVNIFFLGITRLNFFSSQAWVQGLTKKLVELENVAINCTFATIFWSYNKNEAHIMGTFKGGGKTDEPKYFLSNTFPQVRNSFI